MNDPELILAGACTLDHDGCVVCSDAGIPLRVISLDGEDALCVDAAGAETTIAVDLVLPVQIGDILLTHGGVAIAKASAIAPFHSSPPLLQDTGEGLS